VKDTESKTLNVNDSRKPFVKKKWNSKQFKGMCHTCGKYGHKSVDCCSKDGAKKEKVTSPKAIILEGSEMLPM
jgi:uncharacterized OB-fold protein